MQETTSFPLSLNYLRISHPQSCGMIIMIGIIIRRAKLSIKLRHISLQTRISNSSIVRCSSFMSDRLNFWKMIKPKRLSVLTLAAVWKKEKLPFRLDLIKMFFSPMKQLTLRLKLIIPNVYWELEKLNFKFANL